MLYFRDYLNEHPDVACEYEALKVSLCARYDDDRDAYADAKAVFVRAWSEAARDACEDDTRRLLNRGRLRLRPSSFGITRARGVGKCHLM